MVDGALGKRSESNVNTKASSEVGESVLGCNMDAGFDTLRDSVPLRCLGGFEALPRWVVEASRLKGLGLSDVYVDPQVVP